MYRVCKTFEIESGHMLSKHPDRCRYPHGHTRRIEFVLSAPTLDANDMVVDFKWISLAVGEFLDRFDHALCINADDEHREKLESIGDRIVVFDEGDPTTERMARRIFEHVEKQIAGNVAHTTPGGQRYTIQPGVRLERVRVWETSSSWAEFAREEAP